MADTRQERQWQAGVKRELVTIGLALMVHMGRGQSAELAQRYAGPSAFVAIDLAPTWPPHLDAMPEWFRGPVESLAEQFGRTAVHAVRARVLA